MKTRETKAATVRYTRCIQSGESKLAVQYDKVEFFVNAFRRVQVGHVTASNPITE